MEFKWDIGLSIRRIPINGIVDESGPWYTYQTEVDAFSKGDIVTTYSKHESECDEIPEEEIYIVKEVLNSITISVDKKIPNAMLHKIWKIASTTAE